MYVLHQKDVTNVGIWTSSLDITSIWTIHPLTLRQHGHMYFIDIKSTWIRYLFIKYEIYVLHQKVVTNVDKDLRP